MITSSPIGFESVAEYRDRWYELADFNYYIVNDNLYVSNSGSPFYLVAQYIQPRAKCLVHGHWRVVNKKKYWVGNYVRTWGGHWVKSLRISCPKLYDAECIPISKARAIIDSIAHHV